MSTTSTSNLYEIGNRKFFAASINANGTFGAKEYHEGLMEVQIEFESEITDLSADDDPSFVRLSSPLMGEGTVKLAVLPFAIYSKFFDTEIDANGAVVIKSTARPKEVAFGFYSSVGDGSESMFTLYRAVFQLPALASISFDGTAIRDLTLNVKIYPYRYTTAANGTDTVTYTILNSTLNSAIWARVQNVIYIPDMTVPAAT